MSEFKLPGRFVGAVTTLSQDALLLWCNATCFEKGRVHDRNLCPEATFKLV
jgi:hypothetical protein